MADQISTVESKAMPRGLQLSLCATSLLWAVASAAIAGEAAQGIALRLQLEVLEPLLASIFLVFLLLVVRLCNQHITVGLRLLHHALPFLDDGNGLGIILGDEVQLP